MLAAVSLRAWRTLLGRCAVVELEAFCGRGWQGGRVEPRRVTVVIDDLGEVG